MAKLDRVEMFCNEVMKGKSNRQAYCVAFPNSKKWKETTIDSRACEYCKTGEVSARLKELRAERAEKAEITQEKIIDQLASIGFAKVDIDNLKASDKIKALEVIAKILGLDSKTENNDSGILSELLNYLKRG